LDIVVENANAAKKPGSMLLMYFLVVPHRHRDGIPVTEVPANAYITINKALKQMTVIYRDPAA